MVFDFNEKELFDVIIIGEGIAGLATAYYLPDKLKVLVLSKASQDISNTWMAQGGIAASISKFDSPESHFNDTVAAGDGLCDETVVRVVVQEGRERIVEMIQLGVPFERIDDEFSLAREGGHSFARILHYGDQTGKAIASTLKSYLVSNRRVKFLEGFFFEQIIKSNGKAAGITGYFLDNNKRFTFLAPNVVIATGGACHIYKSTTNPFTATGDGIAAGFRAGAYISDMEFVQFHPTVLKDERSPMLLITEAARGMGARLLTPEKEPFMEGYHIMEDLAPRFVVVRRMAELMLDKGYDYFLLDMRHFSDEDVKNISFIASELRKRGYDLKNDLIPVIPAAHYFIGGLKTDLYGRTNVPGIYACGEASCSGLHGANRLASNSLLEGLVFGKRIADSISASGLSGFKSAVKDLEITARPEFRGKCDDVFKEINVLKEKMDARAGIARVEEGLKEILSFIEKYYYDALEFCGTNKCESEFYNMVLISKWVVTMALNRKESRGVHLRLDYPQKNDDEFKFHQSIRRSYADN
ncbi:MAG: L-aspartate oxidase [Actinobacteria bacterium]|nr:L-aspartate oxidase [Actinomycetota bacterium]